MLFPCNDTVACYFVSCILPRELCAWCVSSKCIHYCKKICDCVNYTATDWFSLLCTMGWILYMCLQLWIKYTIEDKDQVSNMKSKKRSTSPQWNTYTVDHRSYTMGATSIHIYGEASGDKLMRFGICEIGNTKNPVFQFKTDIYTKNCQILECSCHSATPQFQQKTHGNILGRCFVLSLSVITV